MTMAAEAAAALFRSNVESVLFVSSQVRPRELKMADGLRRIGWKVGLIYFPWTPFDHREHFDFGLTAGNAEEALQLAKSLSPRVCHVYSGAIDELVLSFCRDKPCPVVIDLNDIFAPSLFDYCHERFAPTREALSLADGLCARDLQSVSARTADGFVLPPHRIFFPEYCWNDHPIPALTEERLASSEVHVVSVGTFSLETQGMYDSCYLQLVKLFAERKIHFHIYPHWSYRKDHHGSPHADFARDFADFLALEKVSPFVHVHDSAPLETLRRELPGYDFGIVSGGCQAFGQRLKYYKPAYLETCYSGRISDYLDARLPVLVNDEVRFDFDLLRHYGAGVDLKGLLEPDFKNELLRIKRDPGRADVMARVARLMSVGHNAPRLGRFYRGLMKPGEERPTAITETLSSQVTPDPGNAGTSPKPHAGQGVLRRVLAPFWRKLRWLSPRVAKIVLPYRAIRMFEERLHNSLQENERSRVALANLEERVRELEQAALKRDGLARFHEREAEQAVARLREEIDGLESACARMRLERDGAISDLGASREAAEELSRQLGRLLERNAGLEQVRSSLDAQVRQLTHDLGELRERLERAETTASSMRRSLEEAEHARERAEAELHAVKADVGVACPELSALLGTGALTGSQSRRLEQLRILIQRCVAKQDDLAKAPVPDGTASVSVMSDIVSERESLVSASNRMSVIVHRLTHQPPDEFIALDNAPKLLLACMPKSGSTWLTMALEDALGLPPMRCYLEADRNEQELDAVALFQAWGRRVLFVQQHIRYSRITLNLCRAFSTKIVVLTRRLDDVAVSLCDHVEKESPECAMFYTEAEWFSRRSVEERLDLVIDHAMPWYLNFVVGWLRAMERHGGEILHVTYEDLVIDGAGCLDRIAGFYGADLGSRAAEALDRRVGTRFNQGRVGRGREVLSASQQARLRDLARHYSGDVILDRMGL